MLYKVMRAILKPFVMVLYNVKVEGLENIPDDKSYILCANHANAVDPILVAVSFPKRLYSMAKAELFKNKLLGSFLNKLGVFPVKRGEADLKSIKIALKLLSENKLLGIFPEGTRNKTDKLMAEPGIAMLAIKSKVPILPMAIKTNYKLFGRTVIKIGKPINLDEYYGLKLYNEDYTKISLEVMKVIRELLKG